MKVFVARQPIFNKNEEVIAYELLYRSGEDNFFPTVDGDQATAEVIINSFLNIGMKDLSEGKKCFVNFTESLLKTRVPTYFNPSSIVVEILEDVPITEELVDICKELKELGYTIALDDFKIQESYQLLPTLLKYTDIIKVDFLQTSPQERKQLVEKYTRYDVELLAEKVESREEFLTALRDGYHYFQGYFFSKPVVLSSHDVPVYLQTYYQILAELSKNEPSIEKISMSIEADLSLSYKLLKLINSPAFRPKNKIESIKQAIILLGLNEIKKWIYVLSVKSISQVNEPIQQEVIKLSLIRAKLCEQLALRTGRSQASSYLLTGMFSLIDTLLHKNIEDVLKDLPLADEIQEALLGKENDFHQVLMWAMQIEQSEHVLSEIKLSEEDLYSSYRIAVDWANELLAVQAS
ncbi:EAL and HDOD domain-containing protein [Metabacillus herbersteinensis]|uniref:EAL and HDOD domain-containing protein n=1 Tax=Metabacillus herbersteinensis TaxID=283816 RepID=A0ABV6GDF7_9BACI